MIKHSYIFLYTDQDVCVAGEKKLALLEKELLEEHVCLQFFPLFFFNVNKTGLTLTVIF